MLPNGWVWATLDELCELNPKHDGQFPGSAPVSFIPMAAVDEVCGEIRSAVDRPYEDVQRGYTHFADGDVLWAKITPCMENGKSAVARNLTNGVGCGTTEFFILRSRGALLPEYLHRFIRQPSYRDAARKTMQSGVGQARVPKEFVAGTRLPLPPLAEQRRIIARLDELLASSRAARAALDEVPALLEQFRQSVLAAAFRGDLTVEWRPEHSTGESVKGFLAREHPRPDGSSRRRIVEKREAVQFDPTLFHALPNSWCYATIGDLIRSNILLDFADGNHGSLYPRKEQFGKNGDLFVSAKQIQHGAVDFASAARLDRKVALSLTKGWARGGDVLLTHNATVGRVARVPTSVEPFLLGTSVTFYRPNPSLLNADYLFYAMMAPQWQEQLRSIMEQTTRDQVSIQKQAFFSIPFAPVQEQQEITQRLDRVFAWIDSVQGANHCSAAQVVKLERAILAKAFRGELVPQDPNDEPASVLLDRIRAQRVAGEKPARKPTRRATARK